MRRTGGILLVLLAGGALSTLLTLADSLRARLYHEHVATAEVALRSVGATLTHAHKLGVPLGQMVGLDELLHSRGTANTGIAAVRLLDEHNQVVWRDGQRSVGSAKVLEVPIGTDGRLQAEFVAPDDATLLIRVAGMLFAVTVALALPLSELGRLSDLVNEGFSTRYFHRLLDAVRRGDLRATWQPTGVGRGDARLHFLREQVLLLNEEYQRVVRLVGSLQRTEPDAARRDQMSVLLDGLGRRFLFAGGAGPMDRRVWPAAGAARCFAALTLVLANLSLGGSGTAPYSALVALFAWSTGLLAGTAAAAMPWPARLRAGMGVAALANVLMTIGAGWSDVCAHIAGGLSTCLAACAALDAARGGARRVTAVVMLLAGSVAGPALGLALLVAFGPFTDAVWFYGAATLLAVATGGWLSYRLVDESIDSGASRVVRIARAPVLAGMAWSAAIIVFIAQSSGNHEQALRLAVTQLPGLLLLASARSRVRTSLAVALGLIGAARLLFQLFPAAVLSLNLTWLGAVCVAGALAVPRGCRRMSPTHLVGGLALGMLVTLAMVAVAGRVSPHAPVPVALCVMLVSLGAAFVLPEAATARTR